MFRNFPTETVKLIKEDDQIIEFEALFSKGKFFVEDTNLPVKEGYTLVRTLPNGFEEEYVITDTGYYPKFHNIQAHYQIEVIKKSMQKSAGDATTTVFVTNNQGKINVSSTDYSTNYYSNLTPDELFDSLREVASG